MKKILYVILAMFIACTLFACGKKNVAEEKPAETVETRSMYENEGRKVPVLDEKEIEIGDKKAMESNVVEMKVKDYGTITIELDPSNAPITCANFKKLISEKFYDGLTFHRIIQGFMIQGGDPMGNGMGGSDQNIKGEFASNGVNNKISHKRGVISMARASDPDSGSSQFFICDADDEFLDGNYAAFGHVTKGMDVVDKIAANVEPIDDNGTVPSDQQPIIESIKIK